MKNFYQKLLENNKKWVAESLEKDPLFSILFLLRFKEKNFKPLFILFKKIENELIFKKFRDKSKVKFSRFFIHEKSIDLKKFPTILLFLK